MVFINVIKYIGSLLNSTFSIKLHHKPKIKTINNGIVVILAEGVISIASQCRTRFKTFHFLNLFHAVYCMYPVLLSFV